MHNSMSNSRGFKCLLFLVPMLVNLSTCRVSGAPVHAEVTQFPDFNGPLPSKHYAGYITVGDQDHKRHLYYYFATSERSPLEDPMTIWINGGPACAGLCGLFQLVVNMTPKHWLWVRLLALAYILRGREARGTREKLGTSSLSGKLYMQELLEGSSTVMYQMFRMEKNAFIQLCDHFESKGWLTNSKRVDVKEKMAIFLLTICHNCRNRFVKHRFQHSGQTISKYFHEVLMAMMHFSLEMIVPPSFEAPMGEIRAHYLLRQGPFKGAIGALDGTLINASIPVDKQIPFRGRGGGDCYQNVMAICDFDMKFTYVVAGWEGVAHDSRVLNETLRKPTNNFPVPPLGPFKIEHRFVHVKERRKIMRNPFSWTKVSNLLFVDFPAGTGYSYADKSEDYITDDAKSVLDLYEFVLKWFMEYPEFLPNPLYLAGCSYSGVIVPVLAQEIANGIEAGNEPTLNFKGYSLGNAAIDIDIQNNAQVPFAHRMGLISDELYEDLSRSCSGKYWDNDHPDCLRNLEIYEMQIKGINKEHILCLPCHHEMGISMDVDEYDSIRMYQSLHGENEYNIYCHNYEKYPHTLFDLESSRQNLHAMPAEAIGTWKRCSILVHYERNIWDLTAYHLNLTMKGYRAFFYSGDHDMVLPYMATLKWIRRFNYSEIEKWHPWLVDEQIAGYTVRFDHNILFATIKGAGHTVWEYMPREALICYQRWIDSDSLR